MKPNRLLYKVDRKVFRDRLDELCVLLDLGGFLTTPVRQLSLGQRMRGDIAAALLHDPAVLVLDEPTIGLDVVSKAEVRDFLRRRNTEHGTTVLLTTHDLGDVERLCRRVLLIDHGSLAFDGTLDGLRALVPGRTSIEDVVADLYLSSRGSPRTPPRRPVRDGPSGTA